MGGGEAFPAHGALEIPIRRSDSWKIIGVGVVVAVCGSLICGCLLVLALPKTMTLLTTPYGEAVTCCVCAISCEFGAFLVKECTAVPALHWFGI